MICSLTRCSDASRRVSLGSITAALIVHASLRPVAALYGHTVSQSTRSWSRQPPNTGRTNCAPNSSAMYAHNVQIIFTLIGTRVRRKAPTPMLTLGRCIACWSRDYSVQVCACVCIRVCWCMSCVVTVQFMWMLSTFSFIGVRSFHMIFAVPSHSDFRSENVFSECL